MDLSLHGVPIHTRALSVVLHQADPPDLDFRGYVLDLRKRGLAPVTGELQGTGVIHHMEVEGSLDRRALALKRIAAHMPRVAVEASAATGGESCRDLMGRVESLAGTPLENDYARRVGAEIGGPRGCSHVLTLTHLVGPTARWAIAEDRRLNGPSPQRRLGERVFRRDIVVDLHASDVGLEIALQLNDLHLRPTSELAPAPDRFAAQLEVQVAATVSMPDLDVISARIAERRRTPEDLATAEWLPRPDRAAPLVGDSLRPGITGTLLRQFGAPGTDQPLLDALLQLAPACIQCFASFFDAWTKIPWAGVVAGESGGYPDSCYIWRRDGAVARRPKPTAT